MVFMVRLIPGLFFVFLCTLDAAEFENDPLKVTKKSPGGGDDDGVGGANLFFTLRNKTFTDQDVENIVKPYKFGDTKLEHSTDVIKLQQSESYTTKRTENSRVGSGRSIDIDIEKYISPDFHNAVHASTGNYASEEKPVNGATSSENFPRLTTPETPFFDGKYKETVDSIDQKLESLERDFGNITQSANYSADNFIDETENKPNVTKYHFKDSKQIELNDTLHPNGQRQAVIKETRTLINVESRHNRTKIYNKRNNNDLRKENIKYLLGDENDVKKDSTERTNFHLTTKKYGITKPPPDKTDTGIISNKIESETLKYLPDTTTAKFRGTIRFADYQKAVTNPTNSKIGTLEQVVQENQIVPIQVTPPTTPSVSVTENIITTPKNEETTTITETNETVEPEEQQSTTILVIFQPNDTYETTSRGKIKTTIASTPRGFEVSTDTTIRNEETTIITTAITDVTMFTTEPTTQMETTTQQITEMKTTNEDPTTQTTTNIQTTEQNDETTTIQTIKLYKPNAENTTILYETTTFEPTTMEITTTPEPSTHVFVESTPAKTLLENQTTSSTQEVRVASTTAIGFVHIKNVDRNHTTLLPDVLSPNDVYTTPTVTEVKSTTTTTTTTTTTSTTRTSTTRTSTSTTTENVTGVTDETTHTNSNDNNPKGLGSGNGAVVAIVISCVGGICLIALASLLIVMRNRQKRFNYGQRCRPVSLDEYSVDNGSIFNSVRRKTAARSSKRSYGNPAFEDPVCLTHPLNFPAISKFASNEEEVHAEFGDIPQIIAKTSELPEGCETKNRYANVIPLPESRVFLSHLQGYSNSDYINANFVTGPKNVRKYYIACQAPMSNTVDDFWRMIWEHQCKVILMLTHLFENGVEKCYDYLPPSEVLDCHRLFGDFQVTLKKREVKEKYIISSIQLKNMVSNSWREVTHFWYMGWPEKGVPSEANSIIAFLIEARSYMKTATIDKKTTSELNGTSTTEINPVVVHCSPGTGRTGVVITCDIAIRDFEQTRQVDIPKILYKIRRDRASAVQTKDQYAFIYKVVDLYATKLAGGGLESI